ncbi:MAG: hypothetical protein RMK52_05490 [Chitinophagales bacterium]|nr:hypothetical protein [Chitinophagales bacterium]MDW8393682.1 hypothetical protein [Chitinophagales bacterium]
MLDSLLNSQKENVIGLLQSRFNLPANQARQVADTAFQTLAGFFQSQVKSGKLNTAQLADLFNKNTPNQSNALFSQLSQQLSGSLGKLNLDPSLINQVSGQGLDDMLKKLQEGPLGNMDEKTISSFVSMLSGEKSPLGGLLSNLGSLFKK